MKVRSAAFSVTCPEPVAEATTCVRPGGGGLAETLCALERTTVAKARTSTESVRIVSSFPPRNWQRD